MAEQNEIRTQEKLASLLPCLYPDKLANLPWWARIFFALGFPTAVAIVLLAALLGWMPSPMMTALNRLEYQSWYQAMLLRQICYRLSEKSEDRRNCEPWKEPRQ